MRTRCSLIALCCLFVVAAKMADAEIYGNITPLDTFADVKAKLPGATYEQLHPAWAQEADILYSVSGHGLSGTIVIKFHDQRPFLRKKLLENSGSSDKSALEKLVEGTDEASLNVEWVRWIPVAPIPLQRLVSKYGKPDKSGFADDDLQPYRDWKTGVTAYLSDDEKSVLRLDFSFNAKEIRDAYQSRYGFVPDFLGARAETKTSASAAVKPKRTKKKSPA